MKYLFGLIVYLLLNQVAFAQTNTLDQYLDVAHNNSPLLKDLKGQIASNQLDSAKIRAGFKPQVNASSGGLYAPYSNGWGYASAITNEHTLNALASVNQTIIGKKNIDAQLQQLTLQSQSVGNTIKISEQDLKKAITAQYITAYGDLQQVKFNHKVIDLLSTEEGLLKKLTRNNVYRQSDYLTFLVTLKQQQLQLSQSVLTYKNDLATLNYLAGIADTTMRELVDPDLHKTFAPDAGSSIFFAQYKIDSLKLRNSRQLLDFSYHPKANIFADGGFNSDFMGQAYKNWGTSIGFNITMPLYDGGQRKLERKKIDLQEESRRNYKVFFDTQYRQQIAQLNQQIDENQKLIGDIDEQIKYTEGLIKVDTKLLETGDVKIADLILAINNYLTVQNLRTQTFISKLQLINQLNYWNK